MDGRYSSERCAKHPGHPFDLPSVGTTYSNNSGYDRSIVINGPVGNLHQHAATGVVSDQPRRYVEDINHHFRVPHRLSSIYTGRETLLNDLKKYICPPQEHDFPQMEQKLAFVHGVAGSGKTQLFRSVFWVDVSSSMTAREGLEDILACLGEATIPCSSLTSRVGYALATYQAPWLLVLDNANSLHLDIHPYIPNTHRGSVIVISTNSTLKHIAPDAAFAVDLMDANDASSLFVKASRLKSAEDQELILKVIKQLDCLPLAIVQAASSMTFKRLSLKDLSASLVRAKHALLDAAEDNSGLSIGHLPVFATYDITIQSLSSALVEDPQKRDDTLELFNVLAFLGKGGTPVRLFSRAQKAYTSLSASCKIGIRLPRVMVSEPNESLYNSWNDIRFWAAIHYLEVFGLVQVGERKSELGGPQILIHDLVHYWARYRQQSDQSIEQSYQLLALTIIGLSIQESHGVWRLSLLLQLRSCLSREEDDDVQGLEILHAEDTLNRFRKILRDLSPIIHASMAHLLLNELPKVAESLLASAYDRIKTSSTQDISVVVFVLEILGDGYISLGYLRKALKTHRKLLKLKRKSFGDQHIVTTMGKLRITLDRAMLGDFTADQTLLKQAMSAMKKPWDGSKPGMFRHTIDLFNSVMYLYRDSCDTGDITAQSRSDLERCWEDFSGLGQVERMRQMDAMNALSEVQELQQNANFSAAVIVAKTTYIELCGVFGEEHPITNFFYEVANSTFMDLSMEATMSRWLRETELTSIEKSPDSSILSSLSKRYGHDHPKTLMAMLQLALFAKEEKVKLINCSTTCFKGKQIVYNDNYENLFSLLGRAKTLSENSDGKYGKIAQYSTRFLVTFAFGLAARIVKSKHPTLSSQFLETAIQDSENLYYTCCGKEMGHTACLVASYLLRTGEHVRAAEFLGYAIAEDSFKICSLHCQNGRCGCVSMAIAQLLYEHTGRIARSGDDSAKEALVRVQQRTYIRTNFGKNHPILTYVGCQRLVGGSEHNSPRVYFDCEGVEELARYWRRRSRKIDGWDPEVHDDGYEVPSLGSVANTMMELPTKITLYVASGFIWEDWLDEETTKSDPMRLGREVIRDARDWLEKSRLSSFCRSLSTQWGVGWGKKKLKSE